jgi:PIN domain nuclease of toxin-antitoxin system
VPLSSAALHEIETSELRVAPIVLFELRILQEIGRINWPPNEWLRILRREFDVAVCALPFAVVIEASYGETWTRDPFDRLIVAQAKAGGGRLISRDRRILEHFPDAIW